MLQLSSFFFLPFTSMTLSNCCIYHVLRVFDENLFQRGCDYSCLHAAFNLVVFSDKTFALSKQ